MLPGFDSLRHREEKTSRDGNKAQLFVTSALIVHTAAELSELILCRDFGSK